MAAQSIEGQFNEFDWVRRPEAEDRNPGQD